MTDGTAIEWTHRAGTKGETWNPLAGCDIYTPGCTNCYAMRMAARIEAINAAAGTPTHYAGTTKKVKGKAVWTGKVALAPEHILTAPLRWKSPRTVFVNSMSDLFHESVPDEWLIRIFGVMAVTPQHTYQVLTKRAARMREFCNQWGRWADSINPVNGGYNVIDWPLPNVWLGVSAEDQKRADERVPELLATPAAIRFVSAEPLLGPIDFRALPKMLGGGTLKVDALSGMETMTRLAPDPCRGSRLDWIIVGGESGNGARPMHPDWARSIRDQCADAGVAFFFKQWGSWGLTEPKVGGHEPFAIANDGTLYRMVDLAWPDGSSRGQAIRAGHDHAHLHSVYRVGKKAAGRLLDGVEHNGYPEARV